jgi:hypothetical protein
MNNHEHELLTALRTIGALQANDRLDTTGARLEIQKPSMYNSFMRTFVWPQSRGTCLERVRTVVDNVESAVSGYRQRPVLADTEMRVLELLSINMTGAVAGLRHLAETYAGTAAGNGISLYADSLQMCHANLREFLASKHVPPTPASGPACSGPAGPDSTCTPDRPTRHRRIITAATSGAAVPPSSTTATMTLPAVHAAPAPLAVPAALPVPAPTSLRGPKHAVVSSNTAPCKKTGQDAVDAEFSEDDGDDQYDDDDWDDDDEFFDP